ncbi:MAG: heavy-metal-associated domain-containing protein [Bacteroidales bacterium]|nr:heavy-metal-associated domain-containing protein [Bacteroidales bacterium]
MCKERIEKKIKKEKGVYSVNVNLDTKYVTIFYNPQKTSPDKLRLAISKLGYQADDIKPDPIAYEKLPTCCKLPKDRKE